MPHSTRDANERWRSSQSQQIVNKKSSYYIQKLSHTLATREEVEDKAFAHIISRYKQRTFKRGSATHSHTRTTIDFYIYIIIYLCTYNVAAKSHSIRGCNYINRASMRFFFTSVLARSRDQSTIVNIYNIPIKVQYTLYAHSFWEKNFTSF